MTKYTIIGKSEDSKYKEIMIEVEVTSFKGFRLTLSADDTHILDVVLVAMSFEAVKIVTRWQLVYFGRILDKDAIIRIGELHI